jgi:hypothetical protein
MALTRPVDFDTVTLRAEIQTMYARVATMPDGAFHFHRGPEYAVTAGAAECGLAQVEVRDGDATCLPVDDSSIVIGEVLPESTLRDIDLWTG